MRRSLKYDGATDEEADNKIKFQIYEQMFTVDYL